MAGRKTAVQASLYFLFPVKFLNPIHPGRHSGKNQIHKREGGHGLHNNHGPGHNHRIMAAFDMDQNILPVLIYGFLFGKNGGCGFDVCPKHNTGAVADAAQDASGICLLYTSPSPRDRG